LLSAATEKDHRAEGNPVTVSTSPGDELRFERTSASTPPPTVLWGGRISWGRENGGY
jgi:hypothetical protein